MKPQEFGTEFCLICLRLTFFSPDNSEVRHPDSKRVPYVALFCNVMFLCNFNNNKVTILFRKFNSLSLPLNVVTGSNMPYEQDLWGYQVQDFDSVSCFAYLSELKNTVYIKKEI